jgi:peroxiredoxin
MKKILLVLFFLPLIVVAQQGKYLLKGRISDFNSPAKVYIVYNGIIADSAILNKGAFKFEGAVTHPTDAYLTLNKAGNGFSFDNYIKFYLEPGVINLISTDSLARAHITGTVNNDDYEKYRLITAPLDLRDGQLETRDTAATAEQKRSPVFLSELALLNKQLESDRRIANKEFIKTHLSSLVSLDALYSYAMYSDYNDVAALFNNLSANVKTSVQGRNYAHTLDRMQPTGIGNTTPDFELPDTNNNLVRLSSYRGKYVLLDFWASWCPVCRENNPGILATYNKYKNKNFTIISVSLDKPGEKQIWLDAIHHDGLTWTQLSDLKFWQSPVVNLYKLTALPQNFLLDTDGKVIARDLDGKELQAKLAALLGKN